MNKDHEKIKELISSYIDGAVSEAERREVEDLILNETQWQEYYKELQRLSGTLQEWRDEEVSADMANEIQKTLLDEKLQEEPTMKGDTWLKVGGGALVTFALCMIIGIVYLRTYSEEARYDYASKSQMYRPETYEPYYLESEYTKVVDGESERITGKKASVSHKAAIGSATMKTAPQSRPVDSDAEYDLAASYAEQGKADIQELSRMASAVSPSEEPAPAKKPQPAIGSFQNSAYTGEYIVMDDKNEVTADEGRTRRSGGFQTSGYAGPGVTKELGDEGQTRVSEVSARQRANAAFQQSAAAPVYRDAQESKDLRLASQIGAVEKRKSRSMVDNVTESSGSRTDTAMGQGLILREEVYNEPARAENGARREYDYGHSLTIAEGEEEVSGRLRRGYDDDMGYGDDVDPRYYPYPGPDPYYPPHHRRPVPEPNTEQYDPIYENPFLTTAGSPLSTFSIDVDTASYSNVRRFLDRGQLPPADAVRIEEMVNYFDYSYPKPTRGEPFSVTMRGSVCPWNTRHLLVQVGLKGNVPSQRKIPPSNLVFLIDTSGSMKGANKLPLLKRSLKLMVEQLRPDQQVAIVTYSGSARLVLDSTPGTYKQRIHAAIDNLQAGGSTAGEAGLRLAYRIARDNYIRNGNNRVILATDGDFNVGMKNDYELVQLIESKRKEGVFLSILGFGSGNYKDAKMEKVADNGNGNYYYIDSLDEGRKVLVNELGSTLFTIAKDVKIQVEFNPQHVQAYRLIGYENRVLNNRDFNNDRVDAGEIGAGHTVTALYEVVPAYGPVPMSHELRGVDRLKYQKSRLFVNQELMTVKLRYKPVKSDRSRLIRQTFKRGDVTDYMDGELAFASAVAEFGLLLRNSRFKGHASYQRVLERAGRTRGSDLEGRRAEFIRMVEQAQRLDHRSHYPQYPYPEPYSGYQNYPPEQTPPLQFK